MMLDTHIKILYKHVNTLKSTRQEVVHNWVDQKLIKDILIRHDINIELFINYYAVGVFDYFIQVIEGLTELGACPIMEEFLEYLKNKDIHADELFILCSHFKKSIIDSTYTHNINTQKVFDAVSFLFDANFSGILKLYTDTIYQKEQVIVKNLAFLNEYTNAIDSSAIVAKTDTKGIITYANKIFCRVSGYEKQELIGVNHNIVRHKDTSKAFYQDMWKEIKSNHIFQGTIKNRKKDGSTYYIDLTIVPLSDPMQGVLEYISIGYDVTKLVSAKEEAHQASMAKERFLSAMSHEIRTPLNAILGFVSVLEEQNKDELGQHYLSIISRSGKQLLHLINDILDFSKINHSQIKIHNEVFHTHETFSHLIDLFSQSAKEKSIVFKAELSKDIPSYIYADLMRIQQIISNLLSNAIKFTENHGEVQISITNEKRNLIIKVKDNGIGISKENQDNVFKPFIQAQKDHEGTGLGLAITRELITAMKGQINLESIQGKGSCFTVSLPYEVAHEDVVLGLRKEGKDEKKFFNAHILVVEDNRDNQELIGLFLKGFGISFDMASDGEEAFNIFKEKKYDMIILDDEMPKYKGFEVAFKIREEEKMHSLKATPLLLLSANATPEVQERALKHGCDYFLSKPIEQKELQKFFSTYFETVSAQDTRVLANRLSLDEEDITFLLDIFKKNLGPNLEKLQISIDSNNYIDIAMMAHKIKGSSSNFHFQKLVQITGDMEHQALESKEINYQSLFKALIAEIKHLGF
ncbi:MAG TPA: response regulator [Sulfurimonas sp.]|nr:response regulator [Sulfurimonas sp.]